MQPPKFVSMYLANWRNGLKPIPTNLIKPRKVGNHRQKVWPRLSRNNLQVWPIDCGPIDGPLVHVLCVSMEYGDTVARNKMFFIRQWNSNMMKNVDINTFRSSSLDTIDSQLIRTFRLVSKWPHKCCCITKRCAGRNCWTLFYAMTKVLEAGGILSWNSEIRTAQVRLKVSKLRLHSIDTLSSEF